MVRRSYELVSQLVLRDAHELAGGGGSFEAGDGGELVVVDLGGGCSVSMLLVDVERSVGRVKRLRYLWLGFEALPLLWISGLM